MKTIFGRSALSFALAAGLVGGAAWSSTSYACAETPVLASICIMATPSTFGDFNSQYSKADGRTINITQNQALYSLIGATYGGDGRATFALPDMRGRFLLGSGNVSNPQLPQAESGQKGGATTVALNQSQLPTHTHTFATAAVDFSKVTATTTMTGLTATANLSGVNVSGAASGLTLKGSKTVGTLSDPSGNALGAAPGAMGKIYTNDTPSAAMNSQSIGGNLSMTIANGTTAPVTFTGNPTTVLSGSPGVSGTTAPTGSGTAVTILPPYLAMTYYIATNNALYPSRN